MARCKFCNKEITWMKEGRKNVPVESDGTSHMCEEMINSRKSTKSVNLTDIDPDILKQYEQAINDKAAKTKKTT